MLTIPSGDFDCVTEGEFEETRELKCEMSCPRSHSWQEVEVRLERYGVCTTPGESCLFCGLWEIGCERGSAVLIAAHLRRITKEKVLTGSERLIRQRAYEPRACFQLQKDPRDLEVVIPMAQCGGDEGYVSQRRAQGSPQCLLLPHEH